MERTPGRVVFVKGNEDLDRILERPFAAWRIFLHPAQRKIAYALRYAGPAQVTGGVGTGKTVTAPGRRPGPPGYGQLTFEVDNYPWMAHNGAESTKVRHHAAVMSATFRRWRAYMGET
jgi:hypothetical protein